jgi:hypothetical protein
MVQTKYAKCQSDMSMFNSLIRMYQASSMSYFNCNLLRMHTSMPSTPMHTIGRTELTKNTNQQASDQVTNYPTGTEDNMLMPSNQVKDRGTSSTGDVDSITTCPTTSMKERHRLWEEYRNRNQNPKHNSPNSPVRRNAIDSSHEVTNRFSPPPTAQTTL